MNNVIIGTAGHIDHGKTTLVRALTGIDTDRLKEEKTRGMTIDLGYAHLTLPNGQVASIIDVPGHERFVKNMLAGVVGIDIALLVVAADESVMPQTREHLDILQLLRVEHGIVAITKADSVDPEWLDIVRDEVRELLADTCLASSPIIPVDSVSGRGLPELLSVIQEVCNSMMRRQASHGFRLPIDRVFTLTGFGTIVTGTLVDGTINVGDKVEILPRGLESRARQLQIHGRTVQSAQAGTRLAINLAGVDTVDLVRGDVCASPGTLRSSSRFDILLKLLPSASHSLKNKTRIRFHIGTAELLGRITLLDREELEPGDEAFAQFSSETPGVAAYGDRFVIRSYSPMVTIAGGIVVDPVAQKHRRYDIEIIAALETRSKGSTVQQLEAILKQYHTGVTTADLSKQMNQTDLEQSLRALREAGKLVELEGGRIFHLSTYDALVRRTAEILSEFHSKYPLRPGMPKEELRARITRQIDHRTFNALLAHLEQLHQICTIDTVVCQKGFAITLNSEEQSAAREILDTLQRAGFEPPDENQLLENTGLPTSTSRDILDLLVHQGEIVKVAENLYFHASAILKAEQLLREHLAKHHSITVGQFRDLSGSSRKYAVPLLEYFDSRKITRRKGDERVLLKTD